MYVDARKRWGARSMVVKRWLAGDSLHLGEPVCEIETDGLAETILATGFAKADDPVGVVWRYVLEGAEIGPRGNILEYSDNVPRSWNTVHATAKRPLVRRERYPSIFLSYRREDADAYAGRLHEVLSRAFGSEEVSMDLFSIRPGEVFPWVIQQSVVHARVMIALIGPRWATIADSDGRPRIHSHYDWLHRELVAALDRGTPVLPVLLPGAEFPSLPYDEFWGLKDYQYHQITGPRHWQSDVDDLISGIKLHLG